VTGISNATSIEEDKLQRHYKGKEKLLISLVVDSGKDPGDSLSPICKMHNVSFSIP